MTFKTIPCHESLQPFIRNYWLLTSRCTAEKGSVRIFSNGATSLHFYLSHPVVVDSEKRTYKTALNRHDLTCMEITCPQGDFNVLGVEFVPFCSRIFFDIFSEEHHLTPSDIGDIAFIELDEKIHSCNNPEEQKRLLDEFFCKRLSEIPINEVNMGRLEDVFDGILPSHSPQATKNNYEAPSTSDLAETACLSPKQFTRIFSQYVGMNPKSYLRLLRFNKALQELHRSNTLNESITEVAWRCGYYDLAHMTNDFRQLCGHSPSEVLEMGTKLTETFGANFSGKMKKKILTENLE